MDKEFEPPEGMEQVNFEPFNLKDSEIYLFRLPADVPLSKLEGVQLQDTVEIDQKSSKKYQIVEINSDNVEKGELRNFKVLLPGKDGFKIQDKVSKFYHFEPVGEKLVQKDLEKAGKKYLNTPYVARTHPEGMKLQSLPFGFDTGNILLIQDGQALKESLERYKKSEKKRKSKESPQKESPKKKKQNVDDVEDGSELRRGQPVAHKIFGVASTINSAKSDISNNSYVYFIALEKTMKLGNSKAVEIFTQELLNLHHGQGSEIHWRDSVTCPTEEEYLVMVSNSKYNLIRNWRTVKIGG
ncbi:Geranylgeranyl pyrophosphate synthase [Boothiomyces macroporosus]|uniref:Geranylgeranyl pyrophosphate synthase n=1 Tax=Boothiomyces macroporosus TaxID=261099 RepID=A0AAD5UMD8_9FUNG|nr:Geranylgeranyl pyrophosphate synthase [Boothiomyces macroporosus]